MKRVTVLLDDEDLYRRVKAVAAREGRSVKDVVTEIFSEWLRAKERVSPELTERRRKALIAFDEIRERQKGYTSVQDLLDEMRDERP
jgi:plasmid stability protein